MLAAEMMLVQAIVLIFCIRFAGGGSVRHFPAISFA